MHYYQPGWTLVGGGIKTFEETGKFMKECLPDKSEWLKTSVATFDPDNSKLVTKNGDEISYEHLVVAMGLQLNYGQVNFSELPNWIFVIPIWQLLVNK